MKFFSTFVAVVLALVLSSASTNAQTIPYQSAPPDGANYVTITPTLYWWMQSVVGTVSYTVDISTDNTFGTITHTASVSGGGAASYTVPSSTLTAGTTYYWRVGYGGNYSATWSFIPYSGTYTGSTAPVLTAPPSGSTYGVTTSPTVYWYYITSGSPTYTVEISTTSDFSASVSSYTTTNTYYTFTGLTYGVTYYWRVSVSGNYSSTWSFTPTNYTYTSGIFLTHPFDGATNVPTTQYFYWYGGTAPYTLEISTSFDFTTGVSSYSTSNTYYEVSGLSGGSTTYYWRVSDGTYTSSEWSFTTTTGGTTTPIYDWYVDGTNTNPTPDGSQGNPFTTIQEAIDSSSAGDSIYVADTTYTENLAINEEVSIFGSGCSGVTVTGSHTITANNVSLYGINFTTSGTAITIDVSAATLDGISITYCCFDLPSPGIGVYLGGGSPAFALTNVDISYCEFNGPVDMISNPIKVGGAFGSPIGLELDGLTFSYNAVDKGSIPINLYDEDISNLEFTYNTFTNTDGALYIWNNALAATGVLSDFLFKHNTMDGTNSYGIAFGVPGVNNLTDANWGSDIQVTHCNFGAIPGAYGIGAIGVDGATTFVLDAELNWWETTSGPTHSGNTYTNPAGDPQGASVSDNVDYVPWLSQSHMGVGPVMSFAPVSNPLGGKYSSIQAAIDDAATNNNINCEAGTFTEDIEITTDGINLSGTGYSSTTKIKGVVTHTLGTQPAPPGNGFPTAYPNIHILADNVKIHGFIIESPDVAAGYYSSGIVFTGTGHEFHNNNFHSVIESSVNTVDPGVDNQGNGYAIVMQSYFASIAPAPYTGVEDVSGLKVYDNIFTSTATGSGTASYEGIFLNADGNTSGVEITDNDFSGNIYRGIATMIDDLTIDGNTITTDIASFREGIWVIQGDNVDVMNNSVSGFDGGGAGGYGTGLEVSASWATAAVDDLVVTYNSFTDNYRGISILADYDAFAPTTYPIYNYNTLKDNTYGMTALGAKGDGTNFTIDAKNNYWGSEDGPEDVHWYDSGVHTGTKNEMPAGSATAVNTWVNEVAEITGTLGDEILDEDNFSPATDGLFIEYYPWQTGMPVLSIDDVTTNIGATVTLPVKVHFLGTDINYTLNGKFTYNTGELDYVSAEYGVGTLINGSGWSALFYESTPGTVEFIAFGVTTPISNDGTLFKLLFTVVDGSAGSSAVTGTNAEFYADGSQLFGTSGTFSGTVTYSGTAPTALKGDADLDGNVDVDDITLIAQYINGAVSFSTLQVENADVDDDNDVDADDLSDIAYYIAFGSWPSAPAPAPAPESSSVNFVNMNIEENGLLHLPLMIDNAENVRNIEVTFEYDESQIDYQSFSALVDDHSSFISARKIEDGKASFIFARPNGSHNNVMPGKIIMKLGDQFPYGSVISTKYRVNGGDLRIGPSFTFGEGVTDVAEETQTPSSYELSQNYPNPFNPTTTIQYSLPEATHVTLKIYNVLGQEVATLVDASQSTGTYRVTWNGTNDYGSKVSTGTYIYRVVAGDFVQVKKMVLLK